MRWRSSGVGESATALEKEIDSQPCESTTTSSSSTSSSSPINDEPDSTSSSSGLISGGAIANYSQQPQSSSSSQLLSPDIALGSAADIGDPGDPPYNSSLTHSHSSQRVDDDDGEEEGQEESSSLSQANTKELQKVTAEDDAEGADQEVPWKPQATQSTCEFTHTIKNYSQKRDSGCKKAEYSSTTVDEFGNRWRLIVYVNGNGRASNHHLSLFLQVADADDLPFGWKKAVSYVLTLEHPTGANLSYAKRNPDKTFKLCPKAIDWGWSQFITSDRIQQEGFVQDDSLVVRASVTVKSSSVSIDLDDAELYLKCAVEEGKPDAVQLCLDQGASVNCQFKDDLYTPLHTACSSSTGEDANDNSSDSNNLGSMQVLKLLLNKGADGNACNKWRETPLLIAANNGHRSAVEALLKHGADPSLCSEAGWSALTFAAHKGYDDIVALLLRAGAPVNCRVTEDSSTPLHKACAGSKPGHLTSVKLLLDNGADVHALNKWRETPLLTAANHGQAGAVDALLRAGADPCKCTDTGWSPLSIAAYKGHDDVVRLLLEEGAPTEEADPTLSALLQAATKGLPGTVELLLRHGADHTVTTKKGDTALSILVEQNLIDAAADMVTEYKASIPRCSRDRKKVQRARLLINLRMKQQQREDLNGSTDDDGDESDKEDNVEGTAQHDNKGQKQSTSVPKKKNKKKKKKMTAEDKAKAAEEALLLELEQEDAQRHKEEQEANKKSAKKRKKKERERQHKKEQEEKRLAEEREREEKLRKEREAKEAKERAERERLAAIKRKEEEEKRKRQLQQQREQQQREQQQREQQQKQKEKELKEQKERAANAANASLNTNEKKGKQTRMKAGKREPQTEQATVPAARADAQTQRPSTQNPPTAVAPAAGRNSSSIPVAPGTQKAIGNMPGKGRGWETKQTAANLPEPNQTPPKTGINSTEFPVGTNPISSSNASTNFLTPRREDKPIPFELFHGSPKPVQSPFAPMGEMSNMMNPNPALQQTFSQNETGLNGLASAFSAKTTDVPSVSLFRREKVKELLQRCAIARSSAEVLGVINELTIKKVLYRWMVRSAHESSASLDCLIPSWTDFDQLTIFFQRQFISEGRKGVASSGPHGTMVSMELLKDAGTAMALLCHGLAKDLVNFRRRVEEQIPQDWTDTSIGMHASEMRNGNNSMVVVDWSNRSQIYLPIAMFTKLRERYVGHPSRLLCSIFTAKIRYETKHLFVAGTSMDYRLPPDTVSTLSMKASVSAEVWSDPIATLSGNVFWGQFPDVDSVFGGLEPFGKEGSEGILVKHGGSVCVVPPVYSTVASHYMQRMNDILGLADQNRVPVSFCVFLRAECFLDWSNAPTANDLQLLDPRLRDFGTNVVRVEQLSAGRHSYFSEGSGALETSLSGSLFVLLQNEAGRARFEMRDSTVVEIIRSMGGHVQLSNEPQLMNPLSFPTQEFAPTNKSSLIPPGGYFDSRPVPVSPVANQAAASDFGTIGGTAIANTFAGPAKNTESVSGLIDAIATHYEGSGTTDISGPRRRGRLFDLVDNGEEDNLNDVDVVSGMLGKLNVDLFQNPVAQDVDIEAISLYGIGGKSTSGGLQPRSRGPFG